MKKYSKKVLSLMAATGIVASIIPQSVGASDAFSQFSSDADDITVNSTYTDFTSQPAKPWYFNTTENKNEAAGNMRVYKRTNGYGLTGGSSAIEFVAGKQRQNDPTVELHDLQFTTNDNFYATMDIYVGDARDNDLLQIGGRYTNDSGTDTDAVFFLTGHGAIRKQYNVASTITSAQFGGGYARNNWYRLTMAVNNKDVTIYLDDQTVNKRPKSGGGYEARPGIGMAADMANMGSDVNIPFFGARVRNFTDTSDFGGKPQSFAVKNLAVHSGTYDPANTDTTVSSTAYTVRDTSVAFGGWDNSSGAHSDISGIPADTTVSAFLNNITVPSGASKKVVAINDVDKTTTEVASGTVVTSDMKLFVTAADGAMKLYDLDAAISAANTPTISSSLARYVIDDTNKTITMPDTTVEKLKSVVTGTNGTTVAVKNSLGDTVSSGTVRDTMKLVATKNGYSEQYDIIINNTVAYDLNANTNTRLGSIQNNTLLYKATTDSSGNITKNVVYGYQSVDASKGMHGLHNYANSGYDGFGRPFTAAKGSNFVYQVTKEMMPNSTDVHAYHMTTNVLSGGTDAWLQHYPNALYLQNDTNSDKGDKMIATFKLKFGTKYNGYVSDFAFWPMHYASNKQQAVELQKSVKDKGVTPTADRIVFLNGKIYVGGYRETYGFNSETYKEVGAVNSVDEYDITIVESKGTIVESGVTYPTVSMEAVYMNGQNLLSAPYTYVIKDGNTYTGIRDFMFATRGEVYVGGLKIAMADNYDPTEEVIVTPGAASLVITSDTVTIDSTNKVITGWDGMTAAQLKAAITASDTKAVVSVMNVEGNGEIVDSSAVEPNMLVMVKDKYHDNADYYLLSTVRDTGTTFTVENGNITATRTISIYNAEATQYNKSLIIAGYYDDNGNERMYDANVMKKNIKAANTYDYSVSIPYVSGYTYKAYLWDMTDDKNTPIEAPTVYTP